MKKQWSVTTTLRNPERLVDFLRVLAELDGAAWNNEAQVDFQVRLIQRRLYGYGSVQFYNGLPKEAVDKIEDISNELSYESAKKIFELKNYNDPAMRGRQSVNPLTKLGFAIVRDGKLLISELGKQLLAGEIDMGDAFLKSFLKWQIPSPGNKDYIDDGTYDIIPFVGVLRLIKTVNEKETIRGNKAKGLSKQEFALFATSLVNINDVEACADKILSFRDMQEGFGRVERKKAIDIYRREYAAAFLGTGDEKEIDKFLKNAQDYGDNAIRYFRLTRYLYIRGGGFFVDIEPRRSVEISSLLDSFSGATKRFGSQKDYVDYISDNSEPVLPWETREKKIEIAEGIIGENSRYEMRLGLPTAQPIDFSAVSDLELDNMIPELRIKRSQLQEQLNHQDSQSIDKLAEYINKLENIFDYEDRPILLERLTALCLHALNDAVNIKPNYPVGDDNEPTFTAPSGVPDIECYYKDFIGICEVTMMNGRSQWLNEGQPVMRHLRDFEDKHSEMGVAAYCLFIAPSIHRDTLNTFWTANKYEYEGSRQRIVPLTIAQFVSVLKALYVVKKRGKSFSRKRLLALYTAVLEPIDNVGASGEWLELIGQRVEEWVAELCLL
jgi:hypothetical protein